MRRRPKSPKKGTPLDSLDGAAEALENVLVKAVAAAGAEEMQSAVGLHIRGRLEQIRALRTRIEFARQQGVA